MTPAVFLDSGIFIAFLNQRDEWHEQAVALFSGPRRKWQSSWLVVSETYSWFLHRMGEEPARSFLSLLRSLPGLRLHDATRETHVGAQQMLDRFRGSKLTYTDAASLGILSRHRIQRVWSTDYHLGLTGAEVLPLR